VHPALLRRSRYPGTDSRSQTVPRRTQMAFGPRSLQSLDRNHRGPVRGHPIARAILAIRRLASWARFGADRPSDLGASQGRISNDYRPITRTCLTFLSGHQQFITRPQWFLHKRPTGWSFLCSPTLLSTCSCQVVANVSSRLEHDGGQLAHRNVRIRCAMSRSSAQPVACSFLRRP
jgi:hypothetical protein